MAGKLKPLDVGRKIRPGKYPDGDGLCLVVASATSKNWTYRYWKDSKQRWLGLGSLKDVSLKDARLARDAARLRVKGDRSTPGVDIVQEKLAAREEAKVTEIKLTLSTFQECAEIYIRERWNRHTRRAYHRGFEHRGLKDTLSGVESLPAFDLLEKSLSSNPLKRSPRSELVVSFARKNVVGLDMIGPTQHSPGLVAGNACSAVAHSATCRSARHARDAPGGSGPPNTGVRGVHSYRDDRLLRHMHR